MHSSTPDFENQSFLLSDNQTSSKILALVQHAGCLSNRRTVSFFMILQSQKNNLWLSATFCRIVSGQILHMLAPFAKYYLIYIYIFLKLEANE